MGKLLSVIIPVFNDEANIRRCIESIANQTAIDTIDIIVVNDASTDETLTVLNSLQNNFSFRIINMESNCGAGVCRNVGIRAANTAYVTFVDSDDWVDMSTYEHCLKQIANNHDVVIYGLSYDFAKYNYREHKYIYSRPYSITGEFALKIYAHTIPNEINISPIVNNKLYRRKFLNDNYLLFHTELRYQEDDIFTFEALLWSERVSIVNNCCYHYCQRPDSLIHSVSEVSIRSFIAAYITLKNNLEKLGIYDRYKMEYNLKLKSSLLGVIKRTIDYEQNEQRRSDLLLLLLTMFVDSFNMQEFFLTLNTSRIRSLL